MAVAAYEQTIAGYERPPEAEVYGRSLSTAYRLGALAVESSAAQAAFSPEAEQVEKEFYTSVEEGLGTDVEHGNELEVRDFDERAIINGQFMAKDLKTPIANMTAAGLICADDKLKKESAEGDIRFEPQRTRSYWDHENVLIVDDMAQGKTDYNTRIVVSPYPEEAAAESGDDYWRNIGYVPHIKRGFVQLYFVDEEGGLAGSLSFNGSDKEHLKAVFKRRGVDIPDDESTDSWLQHAITGNFTREEAKQLATEIADEADTSGRTKAANTVEITNEQRPIMEAAFRKSYVQAAESLHRGTQTEGLRRQVMQFADKAHHFNKRYQEALYSMRANKDTFTDDDFSVMHELLVYSTIEILRDQHQQKMASSYSPGANAPRIVPKNITPEQIQSMLGNFGAEGARNNRVYSACGLAISLGEAPEGGNNIDALNKPQHAFGGYDEAREAKIGKRSRGRCVVEGCPTNPREVAVGGCGVCLENCQSLFDAGKDPTKMYAVRKDIGKKTALKSVSVSSEVGIKFGAEKSSDTKKAGFEFKLSNTAKTRNKLKASV